uniref:Uncharacterized protein n=1 Tax=Salix viminalis TaxID=40686 RepID=A0A6N2KD44_SALVM
MTCRRQLVRARLSHRKFKDIIAFPSGKLSLATLHSLLHMQELLGIKFSNNLVDDLRNQKGHSKEDKERNPAPNQIMIEKCIEQ